MLLQGDKRFLDFYGPDFLIFDSGYFWRKYLESVPQKDFGETSKRVDSKIFVNEAIKNTLYYAVKYD